MDVFTAAYEGNLERVRAVVEQDAGIVHATQDSDSTPLLLAASGGHVEVVRYLLDQGATVNHRDRYQRTALNWACFCGNAPVVLLLLQRGADATAADVGGSIPLMDAARAGRDAVVGVLLEHGGSHVDAASNGRWTACHLACHESCAGLLRQLLEAGADPTLRDADGRVAGDLAADNDHEGCVAILKEWHRAYTLHRARSVRDASLIVANSSAPVDAAPAYLVDRVTSAQTMPTLHVSTHQPHGQPAGDVGEEGHVEVGPAAVGGVVTVYAIEELNREMFVELMELMGTTGCAAHEL